jgi:hypothetical protein
VEKISGFPGGDFLGFVDGILPARFPA